MSLKDENKSYIVMILSVSKFYIIVYSRRFASTTEHYKQVTNWTHKKTHNFFSFSVSLDSGLLFLREAGPRWPTRGYNQWRNVAWGMVTLGEVAGEIKLYSGG